VKKFINKKDKIRTLIGDILIRTIITEDLGIRNDNISFEKNPYGKPYCVKITLVVNFRKNLINWETC